MVQHNIHSPLPFLCPHLLSFVLCHKANEYPKYNDTMACTLSLSGTMALAGIVALTLIPTTSPFLMVLVATGFKLCQSIHSFGATSSQADSHQATFPSQPFKSLGFWMLTGSGFTSAQNPGTYSSRPEAPCAFKRRQVVAGRRDARRWNGRGGGLIFLVSSCSCPAWTPC